MKTRWPSLISFRSKKSYGMMFARSFSEFSVTLTYREFSPAIAPWTRNSRQREVFPVPTLPVTRTVFPRGIPPFRMLSSPSTPVMHRSRSSGSARSRGAIGPAVVGSLPLGFSGCVSGVRLVLGPVETRAADLQRDRVEERGRSHGEPRTVERDSHEEVRTRHDELDGRRGRGPAETEVVVLLEDHLTRRVRDRDLEMSGDRLRRLVNIDPAHDVDRVAPDHLRDVDVVPRRGRGGSDGEAQERRGDEDTRNTERRSEHRTPPAPASWPPV